MFQLFYYKNEKYMIKYAFDTNLRPCTDLAWAVYMLNISITGRAITNAIPLGKQGRNECTRLEDLLWWIRIDWFIFKEIKDVCVSL